MITITWKCPDHPNTTLPDDLQIEGCTQVTLSIAKLNAALSKGGGYIGPGFFGGNPEKFDALMAEVNSGIPLAMPIMHLDTKDLLVVVDGRHRLSIATAQANTEDGPPDIPVIVPTSQAQNILNRYMDP